ncbi:3-keto-5-aminohexanoate cleavage protein [Pseudonocardia sp. WMMC193]|uniref:3-keto-5-aminohexanoate cleavage protein n=1 Tax=Pseudonocardia sp. WMMC193 TaxID=2911965 RepID=UPI001F26E6BD|nr:3-keto-5-aminohexanoate cleavage protein [Pseudonocardia sp. WMMC193]MCF7547900.1 3-keto-5-aminohexanoate cleavage protein [Pseudonocardia sp. WMMC193]
MDPLVIVVNPNENTPRDPNPHVPFTADEIAADVEACATAGASVVHFHARTADGAPDHSPAAYTATAAAIRARCEVLLAPALARGTAGERVPDAGSDFLVIDAGSAAMDRYDPSTASFESGDRVLVTPTATVTALLAASAGSGLVPWLASFTVGWSRTIDAHLAAWPGPAVVQLVLGGPEFLPAHPATRAGLDAHLAFLPERARAWVVSAHRADVLTLAPEVIRRGGHLAVGVGDHPHRSRGLPTNAELVRELADLARRLGREVADPVAARRILGAPALTAS